MTSHSFAKGANEWGTRLELSVFRWEGAPAITAGGLIANAPSFHLSVCLSFADTLCLQSGPQIGEARGKRSVHRKIIPGRSIRLISDDRSIYAVIYGGFLEGQKKLCRLLKKQLGKRIELPVSPGLEPGG